MLIGYASKKLQKICEEIRSARKEFPQLETGKIQSRLTQLSAFRCLKDLPFQGPPLRFHALRANWANHYAVRVDEKYRIVFRACGEYKTLPDETPDLETVTEIQIVAIEDYHPGK